MQFGKWHLSFQGGYGRYGRQMSAEDWKQRAPSQGQSWDNFYGSNQSGRLSSASSLSSVRSGSSSSEEVPVEGQTDVRTPFGMGGIGGRRQGPRPTALPDKAVEESRGMQQSYGWLRLCSIKCILDDVLLHDVQNTVIYTSEDNMHRAVVKKALLFVCIIILRWRCFITVTTYGIQLLSSIMSSKYGNE